MIIKLVSFADSRLSNSAKRFNVEARKFGFFDDIEVKSEKDFTTDFQTEFSDYLRPGVRGFGYWVWKPWVIQLELEKLRENDILIYADVGFTINPKGAKRFSDYIERVSSSPTGVLGFQAKRPDIDSPLVDDGRSLPAWRDKYWTKGDLLDYFKVRSCPEIINTPTIQSGLIFFRKCDNSISFVQKWLDVYRAGMNLVDDTPSISPNFPGFLENRHDQAVYSILGKLENIETISSNEFWTPRRWSSIPDWKALDKTPFHATRNLDFGNTMTKTGANSDIARKFSLRNIRVNFILLGKRIMNLFKPVSQRFL